MSKAGHGKDLFEKLVFVNRVTKVVKGGRRFGFSVLVVVGDKKGLVGYGVGKAKEVMEARMKATKLARRAMVRIPIRDMRTLHHDVEADFNAGKVIMRSARPGTGIIAGGAMRAVFEAVGVQDVVAKSLGSSNPYNLVIASLKALQSTRSPKLIAMKRDKRIGSIVSKRNMASVEDNIIEEE